MHSTFMVHESDRFVKSWRIFRTVWALFKKIGKNNGNTYTKEGKYMPSKKEEKKHPEENREPSSTPIHGQPNTAFEMVNKYGTYEIQPTADSENAYPMIAQGTPAPKKAKNRSVETDREND